MKKRQLSQKQISASSDVKTSQTKISSFFKKISKPEASNSKVVTDTSSLYRASNDKKRKQTDDSSELHMIKKTKSDNLESLCNSNTITEYYAKAENIKLHKDSVLLSVTKDLNDACNDFKENKAICADAVFKEITETDTNVTVQIEQDTSTESSSVGTASAVQFSKVACNNSLKEKQDLNTASKYLSSVQMLSKESKLHDLQVESVEESIIINENEFDDFFNQEWDVQTDFTSLQRCKVIDVKREPRVTMLIVQHIESESVDAVACSGFWEDVRVKIDDIVMIQATKNSQKWIVDNNNGFVITQPDLLISGTTITSGLFCNRRAVLAEKFRKIESDLNADYAIMTVGSLTHQWMQKALRENVRTLSDVIKLMDDTLESKDTIEYLYASELSLKDCRKRMMEYAPRIFEFIQHYIRGNKQQRISDMKDNFQGNISEIQDIEENIYLPQLGMKGRIDVTAKVNIHSKRKITPLEIKTGRSSYSFEHKGQVILYLMMMSFRDQDIDTGLLLYLKENSMREIKSSHREKRDLILLRNTLAYYFAKKPDFRSINSESDLKIIELPEPINHRNACTRCPYRTICCAYLTRDPNTNLSPSHPLTTLITELLRDCESNHLDYVIKWIALLQLEELYENGNSSLNSFWTMSPEKREMKGTCICNLKVIGKIVEEKDDRYRHTFARSDIKGGEISIGNCAFGNTLAENDYVCVSTDERINIAAGHISHISHDTIAVLLDKDVTRHQDAHSAFHIDRYPSTSICTFNYANVAGLLSNDETCAKLRRIVIDKRPATFAEKVPRSIVTASAEIISDLNDNQQRAVLKAMTANEYVLIKGMPGTGKTQTLVALIELLQTSGYSVLITAHTHSAVDNVLLKLLEKNIDFVRLGSSRQIHPLLTCKSEEYAIASCDSPENLETFYNSKQIVGVTCYGAYHTLVRKRVFDVCVVDESAQIMQPTVLRPLYSARKFVLVGDPDQLPPVVGSKPAVKLGANESLFVRLDSDSNTVSLSKQYRMNGRIMRLANDVTYRGKLIAGNRQIENATLTGSDIEQILSSCEKWVKRTLSRELDNSVVILNTGGTYKLSVKINVESVTSDQVCANVWEAAVTLRLVQVLTEAGVSARNIGIIAPYNAHINLLRRIVDKEIEVNTVDRYQGRDKDVILYSCARSVECDTKKEHEILDDQRRLTVAITRARHKLIVIADKITLLRYTPFRILFNFIDEKNVINLYDGEEDFSWKSLVRGIDK